MEAPKKIYLFKNPITETPDDRWLSKRSCNDDIEYIRTDAFIEKALKFLDENFFFDNKCCSIESGVFDSKEKMFEDFKKYMEDKA
jgi:hypothetical protein